MEDIMPVSPVGSFGLPDKMKFEINFFSRRRYFPKTEENSEEMEDRSEYFKSGPFNDLPNDVQKEILSYLPSACDSGTISGSTKGLIQYSHVSSKTKRAVEEVFSSRMSQIKSEDSVIYHFVKKPNWRTTEFRNILVIRKKAQEFYENPERIKGVFDIIGFCSANGYKKSISFRTVSTDLIEFFCQFVESSVENKEMAFQHHLRQFDHMTERNQQMERRAFDVILIMLKKSIEFSKKESDLARGALTPGAQVRLAFQRELMEIERNRDHFFENEILPMLNF